MAVFAVFVPPSAGISGIMTPVLACLGDRRRSSSRGMVQLRRGTEVRFGRSAVTASTARDLSVSLRDRMKTRAVYPGTFDPVTYGHIDLIQRSAKLFDDVIVAVLRNADKTPLFTVDERVAMLEDVVREIPNASVTTFDGLLVDFAEQIGASVIVRGIRAVSDYEYELQMAMMNRRLSARVETVFMMPAEAYSYLSSRLVKEISLLGGSVRGLVPVSVEELLGRRHRPGGVTGEGRQECH